MAAPHPSKGLLTRITLSGFCRAKEKKHSFHVATPRKDFQFHSEVTCGTHATCGPWAQGCRRLTPGLVCGGLLQEGGQVCSVPCIADAAKSSEDAARGSCVGRQVGRQGFLGIPVIGGHEEPAGHREQCEERRRGLLASARAWAAHSWGCGRKKGRRASQGPSLELPEP